MFLYLELSRFWKLRSNAVAHQHFIKEQQTKSVILCLQTKGHKFDPLLHYYQYRNDPKFSDRQA